MNSVPNPSKGFTLVRSAKVNQQGVTLVELLVVISIIAILSVLGFTLFSNVQKSTRNTKRISDLKSIATALEIYYFDPVNNLSYPNPGGGWRGECNHPWGTGSLPADDVIPGLVPKYLASFPSDPSMNKDQSNSCYLYNSDGSEYSILDHNVQELSARDYLKYPIFVDPSRDGGSDPCAVDGTNPWSWKISSPGGRCW